MMIGPAILLAVVAGAGKIPIPEAAQRFPDSTAFLGAGLQREGHMLAAAIGDCGLGLRGDGPGPQQLAARWFAGQLNEAEKVVVLLGGGVFHDRSLLTVYDDALRSPNLRLRQAAAVGFFSLVGAPPPLPSQIRDDPRVWRQLHRMVRDLDFVTLTRPLVRVWVDSYVAGKGVRRPELFAFRQDGLQCLKAIREIAEPADLPDVLSIWPFLESEQDRTFVMRTIEAISLQRLVNRPQDPQKPSGDWLIRAALAFVDQWVATMCQSVDGERQVRLSLERDRLLAPNRQPTARTWFAVLSIRNSSLFPLAAERLMDLSGRAVKVDRQIFDNPSNLDANHKLREYLPISSWVSPDRRPRRR
jgi:hypothetical protein